MAKEFSRTARVGGQIQRELAQMIQQELRDPRVGFVTLSDVEVSRDLSHAKVFITLLDPKQDVAATLEALNKAGGFLRRSLGKRIVMRVVPELHFVYDSSLDTGARVDALLHRVAAEQAKSTDETADSRDETAGKDDSDDERA